MHTQRTERTRPRLRRRLASVAVVAVTIPAMMAVTGLSPLAHAGAKEMPVGAAPDTQNIACALSASIGSAWTNPYVVHGHTVTGAGVLVSSPKVFCGAVEWKVFSMTKVCGFWGCNWHQRGQASGGRPNSAEYWRWTSQECRSGTHSYQQIGSWTYTNGWGYPETAWMGSTVRKLTC